LREFNWNPHEFCVGFHFRFSHNIMLHVTLNIGYCSVGFASKVTF
jgi:hypothetical protein